MEGKPKYDLINAAANGDINQVIRLLNGTCDINKPDGNNRTALDVAVCNSHTEIVLELLRVGANIHRSASQGNMDLVKIFIEAGTNLEHKTNGRYTALTLAVLCRND